MLRVFVDTFPQCAMSMPGELAAAIGLPQQVTRGMYALRIQECPAENMCEFDWWWNFLVL